MGPAALPRGENAEALGINGAAPKLSQPQGAPPNPLAVMIVMGPGR